MIIIPATLLVISVIVHCGSLFFLAKSKSTKYLKVFFVTALTNTLLSIILSLLIIHTKRIGPAIDFTIVKLVFSGMLFLSTLTIKIMIFRRIYKRAQQPEHYHLNFFGKKVLHSSVVRGSELLLFFASMPLFLFAGAYFIAKLVDQFN